MRELRQLTSFKRDLKRMKKSGKYSIDDLFAVVDMLLNDVPLPTQLKDHALSGAWSKTAARECHIKPDLLPIYTKQENRICLLRLGSHSELFR